MKILILLAISSGHYGLTALYDEKDAILLFGGRNSGEIFCAQLHTIKYIILWNWYDSWLMLVRFVKIYVNWQYKITKFRVQMYVKYGNLGFTSVFVL